jgi:hypothetical protein
LASFWADLGIPLGAALGPPLGRFWTPFWNPFARDPPQETTKMDPKTEPKLTIFGGPSGAQKAPKNDPQRVSKMSPNKVSKITIFGPLQNPNAQKKSTKLQRNVHFFENLDFEGPFWAPLLGHMLDPISTPFGRQKSSLFRTPYKIPNRKKKCTKPERNTFCF